ncbi:MAG: D-glycero-D-manno-heptose 1,7-bisphosphate phosphatase [Candidatus Latescibacterota bacterium]|jgi:D-glycero-D-manno-heptose 1,7-bisphosphate phosphatase
MSQPAVFIDRDGTINVNVHHLHRVEDLQLIPGAAEAIAKLNTAGYFVIIITNQSAIARGLLTEEGLAEIHTELERLLASQNASINAIYHCPHHPDYGDKITCACRKPSPTMLQQAAADHTLDLSRSFMIGDNYSDLQAGWNAGCQSALVRTGHGEQVIAKTNTENKQKISYIGNDLLDVTNWLTDQRHLHPAPS